MDVSITPEAWLELVSSVSNIPEGQRRPKAVMANTFFFLFIANLFRFYPEWLSGWLQVFWFDIVAVLIMLGSLLIAAVRRERFGSRTSLVIGFVFVSVLLLTSLNAASVMHLTEVVRVIYATGIVILLVAPWFKSTDRPYEALAYIVNRSIPVIAVIFAIQLFSVAPMVDLVHQIYGTEKLRDISYSSPRVYGTFHNANWAGVYLIVAWVVVIWRRIHRLASGRSTWIRILMLLFMTVATGSRSGLIGISVGLLWLFLMVLRSEGLNGLAKMLEFAVMFVVTLVILGVPIYSSGILPVKRFVELFSAQDILEIESAAGRIRSWIAGWEMFLQSPWFGPGVEGIPHNSFITWLLAFGVIGFVALVFLIVSVVYAWLKLGFGADVQLGSAVFWGFMAMGLTADVFFTTQLLGLVLPFIFGVFFARSKGSNRDTGAYKWYVRP